MFDNLDKDGVQWQTKAFDCVMHNYKPGDYLKPGSFQVEIARMGGIFPYRTFHDSLATVRNGHLEAIDVPRDASLPLLDYHGDLTERGGGA